jgi:hypothetical protein
MITDAIRAFLQQRIEVEKRNVASHEAAADHAGKKLKE